MLRLDFFAGGKTPPDNVTKVLNVRRVTTDIFDFDKEDVHRDKSVAALHK
jgi:hypothetical protein